MIATQPLLIRRGDLLASGCTEAEVRRRCSAAGDLVAVRRGVYVDRTAWGDASLQQRHLLTLRAALLDQPDHVAASHGSAALLHRLPVLNRSVREVHLTRPGAGRTRTRAGLTMHRASLERTETLVVDGLTVTDEARTVADIVREDGFSAGLVAADAALARGLPREALVQAAARQAGWPGSAAAARVAREADPGGQTPGESLTRELVSEICRSLGLPAPETQFEVRDRDRVAYADLRVGRVLIEFDGKVKYGQDLTRAGETPGDVAWREKVREDWLRAHGFTVVRVIWSELFGTRRAQLIERLTRSLREHA